MELKRVVVTGLGAVTPVGNNPEETWNNLVNGVSGAAPITLFDATNFKTQFACEVKGLNINEYIDRKEARKMDRYTQLAFISAIQAVKDSGMDLETIDKNRIGVVFGVGIGGTMDQAAYLSKRALMRNITVRNEHPDYANLENELLEMINKTGIGPQLGGTTSALAVNIEWGPTHIAGLPVAVTICCHACRHAVRVL